MKVFFEYSKHMILLDYLEATGVRHGKPAFLKNIFGSLKKLEFDGAIKREIVIPSHVLPFFNFELLDILCARIGHPCEKS